MTLNEKSVSRAALLVGVLIVGVGRLKAEGEHRCVKVGVVAADVKVLVGRDPKVGLGVGPAAEKPFDEQGTYPQAVKLTQELFKLRFRAKLVCDGVPHPCAHGGEKLLRHTAARCVKHEGQKLLLLGRSYELPPRIV